MIMALCSKQSLHHTVLPVRMHCVCIAGCMPGSMQALLWQSGMASTYTACGGNEDFAAMCGLPVGLPQVCERSVVSILLRINRAGLDLHYNYNHGSRCRSALNSVYTLPQRAGSSLGLGICTYK